MDVIITQPDREGKIPTAELHEIGKNNNLNTLQTDEVTSKLVADKWLTKVTQHRRITTNRKNGRAIIDDEEAEGEEEEEENGARRKRLPVSESDDVSFALGIRSFLELRPYFEEMYEGYIPECILCSDLVIRVTLHFISVQSSPVSH